MYLFIHLSYLFIYSFLQIANATSTGASTGSDLNGGAVKAACSELRERLLKLLKQQGKPPWFKLHKGDPDDLTHWHDVCQMKVHLWHTQYMWQLYTWMTNVWWRNIMYTSYNHCCMEYSTLGDYTVRTGSGLLTYQMLTSTDEYLEIKHWVAYCIHTATYSATEEDSRFCFICSALSPAWYNVKLSNLEK